jgi:hypothetical protein
MGWEAGSYRLQYRKGKSGLTDRLSQGRGRHCCGGGRSWAAARAPSVQPVGHGRRHGQLRVGAGALAWRAAGSCGGGAAGFRWARMGSRANESRD